MYDSPSAARQEVSARVKWGAGDLVAKKYRLVQRIGRGGMGDVWRARHLTLNLDCAIKFVRADLVGPGRAQLLERFHFEAQVSAQLAPLSPHVVRVIDAGAWEESAYLVMDYVPGGTLEDLLRRENRLSPAAVADLLDHVADALDAAHGRDILHRDIKPSNILLEGGTADGLGAAKVADFGVAKATHTQPRLLRPKDTSVGRIVGSPPYISPETAFGEGPVDHRSDLWSLAVVAFEALTGRRPFGTVFALANGEHPTIPRVSGAGLPRALDTWFERALAIDPSRRFDSGREMALAFRVALSAPKRRLAPRVGLALAAVALLAFALFGRRGGGGALRLRAAAATCAARIDGTALVAGAPTPTIATELAPPPVKKSGVPRRRKRIDPSEIQ